MGAPFLTVDPHTALMANVGAIAHKDSASAGTPVCTPRETTVTTAALAETIARTPLISAIRIPAGQVVAPATTLVLNLDIAATVFAIEFLSELSTGEKKT